MGAQVTYFSPRVSCIQNKASRGFHSYYLFWLLAGTENYSREIHTVLSSLQLGEGIGTVPQMENTLSSQS